jgi:Tfp pilus assembly protein PilV
MVNGQGFSSMGLKASRSMQERNSKAGLQSVAKPALICGASLIEVLVAILLIGVSLGAIFKLNNAAVDEMRSLKEHHFVQNLMNDLVKNIRLYYDSSLRDVYSISGSGTAYPSASCVKNCSNLQVAKYDVRTWTEELQRSVHGLKYYLVVSNKDYLRLAVAWHSSAQTPSVNSKCPIKLTDSRMSCFVLTAPLDE